MKTCPGNRRRRVLEWRGWLGGNRGFAVEAVARSVGWWERGGESSGMPAGVSAGSVQLDEGEKAVPQGERGMKRWREEEGDDETARRRKKWVNVPGMSTALPLTIM